MELYAHSPLRRPWDGHREIRILTLRRGLPADDIRIDISTHTIDDDIEKARTSGSDHSVQWEALSYTWGDMQGSHTISVGNAETGLARFEVGQNLFTALQHLRYNDADRQLWMDAICMDQSDTEQAKRERAWQIPAMLDIYSVAARVIIWLGEERDDSSFAMQFLQQLGEGFDIDWSTYEMTGNEKLQPGVVSFLHRYEEYFGYGMRQYEAVCALLERDWFTRVWIRQEAFAASEDSVITCGSVSIPLRDFRNAMHIFGERGLDVKWAKHELHSIRLRLAITIFDKATMSIPEIIHRGRGDLGGICKHPVDKVYGYLYMMKISTGTTDAGFASSIQLGHKEPLSLYKEFFRQYTTRYNNLNLLKAAGLHQQSALGGPSWMPDWLTPSHRLFRTSSETAISHAMVANATFESGKSLRVQGIVVDTVLVVDTIVHSADHSDKHWPAAYTALARFMDSHLATDDQPQFDDFMQAFLTPLKGHRIPIEDVLRRKFDYEVFVKAAWAGEDPKMAMLEPDPQSFAHFQICLRNHEQTQLPFIFTDKGLIGISTKDAQPGDLITAILGSQILLILRPIHRQYQLVGTCSMHSLSTGEALLGPLPAGTMLVSCLDHTTGTYRRYFHDASTDEDTFWDPRIDWKELEAMYDNGPSWKLKPPYGEAERHAPTAEYFLRRGIEIVSFDLI